MMGGFSSGNSLLGLGAMALDAITGVPVASTALALGQANDRRDDYNSQLAAQQQAVELQAAALQRQEQQQVRERNDLLKRTLSAQRARLSAMGLGAGSGSTGALMAGLTQQAAQDVADIEAQYGDRLASLDLRRQQLGTPMGAGEALAQALTPTVSGLLGRSRRRAGADDNGGLPGFSLL